MNIPMVDLKEQYHRFKNEIDSGILQALEATQFILGPNVQAFEKEAAEYLGVKHAIGVANGTDALHLALAALDIGPGDEVITTPFTFIATAEAIKYVGATPVFVDIDAKTFNIDLAQVEKAITSKTRAVIPVHLFGQPVDMNALKRICDNNSINIVEDCAQSFGAHINNQKTGSIGDVGAFSFFPSKNLGCYGDGGLISTNSDELATRIKTLRNHGSSRQYHHNMIGYNSRLDELQAVILRIKLKHIDDLNTNRRRVDQTYKRMLAETNVVTPYEDGTGLHVYHQYCCLHEDRDLILQSLRDSNIACAIYYPIPLHKQDVFAVYPELGEDNIKIITDTIKTALA